MKFHRENFPGFKIPVCLAILIYFWFGAFAQALSIPRYSVIIGEVYRSSSTDYSSVYFNLNLSSQPDSDVVISVSLSDKLERVNVTDSMTFTRQNWSEKQKVEITGVDLKVIRELNDFHVVLGLLQSDDIGYSQLFPLNVSIGGKVIYVEGEEPTDFFVSDLLQSGQTYIENKTLKPFPPTPVIRPAGLTLYGNTINWKPPRSQEGNMISVVSPISGEGISVEEIARIHVMKSVDVDGLMLGKRFTVTDERSTLHGIKFEFQDGVPCRIGLREINDAQIPPLPRGVEPFSNGFYALTSQKLSILIPLSVKSPPKEIRRLEYLSWNNTDSTWSRSSASTEVVEIESTRYVKFSFYGALTALGILAWVP